MYITVAVGLRISRAHGRCASRRSSHTHVRETSETDDGKRALGVGSVWAGVHATQGQLFPSISVNDGFAGRAGQALGRGEVVTVCVCAVCTHRYVQYRSTHTHATLGPAGGLVYIRSSVLFGAGLDKMIAGFQFSYGVRSPHTHSLSPVFPPQPRPDPTDFISFYFHGLSTVQTKYRFSRLFSPFFFPTFFVPLSSLPSALFSPLRRECASECPWSRS